MKFSIITINYNNIEGLKRTFDSIISVKNEEFEYLVIDGGSTDGSTELIKSNADKIDYWVSEPDRGIYHAMNKGIERAKGEYLLFINSGDEIIKGTNIFKIIEQLTGEDIIYYNIEEVLDVEQNIRIAKQLPSFLDFRYFALDALSHQSSFIKRQCLIEYGGYSEEMKIFSDWAFFMDGICQLGYSYKHVDEYLSVFYQDGISANPENKAILWKELKAHINANYPIYRRLYNEWTVQREQLHKLRMAKSIQLLKKLGFLKWFKIYAK